MSPEQAQGIKSVDFRSDLWSLAVIAYQAITGQLPFQSEALGDLLVKIIVHPIPTPSQVAQVPPGFDAWFAKATQRDPNLRFQSAKDFADSLTLAIGASQLTDVMDGRMLRAQIAAGQTAGMGSGPHLPFGSTPQPNQMPFGATPQPGQQPQGDPRFMQTPNPAHHSGPGFQSSGGFPAHGNTGAPFTTTASGAQQMPAKSMTGMIVGGVVGVIAIVLVGVGAFIHFSSHTVVAAPVATASATPTTVATASAAPTTTAATTAVAITTTTTTSPTTSASTSGAGTGAVATGGSTEHPTTSTHTPHTVHSGSTSKSSKSEDSVEKMGF
jgi:serine/threonine-protein kinase